MALAAFIFGLGIMVGLIIARMLAPAAFGTLRIDRSNPAKDIYRIEIDDFDELANQKRIVLNVDRNAIFTQE